MKLALADIRSDDEIEDFAEALLDSLGLPKEFEWNEEDHPRHEAGSSEGGRFAPKGEGGQHPQKGKPRAQAGSLGEQLSPAEKAERAKLVAQVENAAKEWVAEKRAGGGTFGRKELAELSRHLGETQGEAIDAMISKFSDPKNYHERPMVHLCIGDEQNPDIWLLGWRENMKEIEGTPIHDHGDSEAGIYVHRGSVTEHIYAIDKSQVGKGIGSEVDFRQVERGFDHKSTATINAPYIHDIYDAEGGSNLSVTIHSYYPPLRHMRFYEVKGDKLVQTGEWDDRAKKHALLHYDRTDWTRSPFGHCQRYHGDHDQDDHGNWADGQGGSKADSSQTKGRLTEKSREAFVGEYPEGGYESEAVQAYYAREKEWQRNVREDLSFGRLTPKEARALGYTYTGERDSQEQWKPLPEELWHVTTATDAVNATGLKTRDELKMQSGSGLGGGQSDTISFTADPKVAEGIYRGVLEAREVAAGNVSAQQLLDAAFAGNQAEKEWGTAIVRGFDKDWKQGDPYPYAIDTLLRGVHYKHELFTQAKDVPPGGTPVFPTHKDASGEQRYTGYEIPMTPEERAEETFDFYKRWATFREFEGKGPLDPLFFLTDVKALAATPPEQISIGKFRPIPGAQGFTVSALGEWRVYTGKVVEPVANERPAVKLFHLEGAHDQGEHGNWADGESSDRGDSKAALQRHLVDYKAERELTGPGTIPIKELLPKSNVVGYLDVPNIDKMHRLMQVTPSLKTDPKRYVDARDRLFKGEPVMPVPIGVLTFTQPKINTDRAQELTKTPEQLEIPVQVVRSGSKFFLMNGHHRVIASHLAGRGEIAANVLDLNRPHEFEWFPYHLQGQHDQQTHNPHLDSAKKVEMETKFLKDRATKSEPATTKLIKEVVDRNEGKLEGLDFRVKSEESLARKIAARARANPGLEPGDVAANSISDALRYTAVLKDDQYATAVKDMLSHLESKGFKVDKIKNYWQPGDDYNGINVTLRDPEELKVELQFHTPDSFHVKEKESHPLYEKMRTAKDPTVAKQLKQQMIDIWSKVQVPAGVMTLGILATT